MLPTSIRWRLPLSYAAIALLTALALGLVLLTTLRSFYHRQELDYLTQNAQAIGARLTPLLQSDPPPEALRSQLSSFAFLSQTQIRLLNPEGQLWVDSGPPAARQELAAFSFEVETQTTDDTQTVTQTVTLSNPEKSYAPVILIRKLAADRTDATTILWQKAAPEPQAVHIQEKISLTAGQPDELHKLLQKEFDRLNSPHFVSFFPAAGTPYGFGLGPEQQVQGQRSQQRVQQPLYTLSGDLLGYLELSRGPAYGQQVLRNVARGWAMAGGVAMLLAAATGWLISWRISDPLLTLTQTTTRMAQGNLSVRAKVTRADEFGTLGHVFNQMARQVEQTVDTLRHFVADAAHELHTPLTALRTNLELLSDNDTFGSHPALQRAQTQVTRLETLTNHLLDLSRLETGAGEKQFSAVNLTNLLKRLGETYASQAEQTGLGFDLHLPAQAITTDGNPAQLEQALSNLLDNALKFTPAGGQVECWLGSTATAVEIQIADTGIGIPPNDLPQLFSRFHRGSNAAAYPGSGLGLAIVKAIVTKHGGSVSAKNKARGARFTIRLPNAEQPHKNIYFT